MIAKGSERISGVGPQGGSLNGATPVRLFPPQLPASGRSRKHLYTSESDIKGPMLLNLNRYIRT